MAREVVKFNHVGEGEDQCGRDGWEGDFVFGERSDGHVHVAVGSGWTGIGYCEDLSADVGIGPTQRAFDEELLVEQMRHGAVFDVHP